MQFGSLVSIFIWIFDHLDHVRDLFLNFVNALNIIQSLGDVLSRLDLELHLFSKLTSGIVHNPGKGVAKAKGHDDSGDQRGKFRNGVGKYRLVLRRMFARKILRDLVRHLLEAFKVFFSIMVLLLNLLRRMRSPSSLPIVSLILVVKSVDRLEFLMSVEFTEILVGGHMVSGVGIKFPLSIHELLLQKTSMVELDVLFLIKNSRTKRHA